MEDLERSPCRQTLSRRQQRRRLRRRRRRRILLLTAALLILTGFYRMTRPLPGEGVALPSYVTADLLPCNRWSRPGLPLKTISGVVIHYVGNPGTTAQANRNYFASLADGGSDTYASSHFIVGLEGEVLQCIPLTEIAYASNSRNADTIAIEVCHPDESGMFSPVTCDRLIELTAYLCQTFHLDPETDVIRHYDVTGKQCPRYYVAHPDAWDALRREIRARCAEKNSAA